MSQLIEDLGGGMLGGARGLGPSMAAGARAAEAIVAAAASAGHARRGEVVQADGWRGSFGLCGLPSCSACLQSVIPAKAGIQRLQSHAAMRPCMPAFAGMTVVW
ncbi:hypothetical protein, partial [Lysobacter enzymogenes]|uniref:hypothetical protein n=1 Tax=Lysobacter enzymogenes TaxID=69 RepID=UPI001B8CF382